MKVRILIAIGCVVVLAVVAGVLVAKRTSHSVATGHAGQSVSTAASSIPGEIGNGLTGHGAKAGGLPTLHAKP